MVSGKWEVIGCANCDGVVGGKAGKNKELKKMEKI